MKCSMMNVFSFINHILTWIDINSRKNHDLKENFEGTFLSYMISVFLTYTTHFIQVYYRYCLKGARKINGGGKWLYGKGEWITGKKYECG